MPVPSVPDHHGEVTLAAKLDWLRCPGSYSDGSSTVETIETHMSWLFLSRHLVHKLKKPVRTDFVDFTTVEARKANCIEEVRLNRRLAEWVYLGAVPLVLTEDGRLALDAGGEAVDWLVRMRRLPGDRMLDRAIRSGTADGAKIDAVAATLTRFYQAATAVDIDPLAYCNRFVREIQENRKVFLRPEYGLPAASVHRLCRHQQMFLECRGALFEGRAHDRRIVEGHGDLRPEHVCLADEPVIIDCLEFNRGLRILDPVDELAFLAMECARLGAPQVGERILDFYRRETGDVAPMSLISFYEGHRACLRAKLALWHLREPRAEGIRRWLNKAGDYLRNAEYFNTEAMRQARI